MLLVVLAAEGAMRLAERRFANYDPDLDRGDEPVLKLRAAREVLADGGVLFVGASDAESAFEPGLVTAEAGEPGPGYNASIGGLPVDVVENWVGQLLRAGADPDLVLLGTSPAQYLDLPTDQEGPGGATIDQAQAAIRDNVERASQFAGLPGGVWNHVALIRSRHRLHAPSDAWNALTGGPPPPDSSADLDLRPDGTNIRWDAPMVPGSQPELEATEAQLGEVEEGAVDHVADLLGDLTPDRRAGLVLLPATPELAVAPDDADFVDATRLLIEEACARGVDVLDLTGEVLTDAEFANLAHYSAEGRRRISVEVGAWLAGDRASACP
jgi:hypothetical protein